MPDAFLHEIDVLAYRLVVDVWSLYWPVLGIVAVLTVVERCHPLERNQPWRPWLFNLAWHILLLAVGVILSWSAWGTFVGWLANSMQLAPPRLAAPQGAIDEAFRVVLAFFLYDFLIYWAHRLQHAVPFIWAMHQFHHEERHLNAAASVRSHWVNIPYLQVLVTIPILWTLGADAISPGFYFAIHGLLAYSHMNVRLDLGWFSRVLVGPQYHRIHHARERHVYDCNFATALPLWDIIFGTHKAPASGEFGPTGVSGIEPSRSIVKASCQPMVDWWRLFKGRLARA